MALKVLMLRKKKDGLTKKLDELRNQNDFETREKELEAAIEELTPESTDEEQKVVQDEVDKLEKEKNEHQESVDGLEKEIKEIEDEIKEIEEKQPKPAASQPPKETKERKENKLMTTRDKFFGLNIQERDALFAREEVKKFIGDIRSLFSEKRDVGNKELIIPQNFLPMIKQVVETNSKLQKYVDTTTLTGTGRMVVMGSYPEGVWTEQAGKINELELGFNDIEVDGYKVAGFFKMHNAVLEDNDVNLANVFLTSIGIAIAKATDKAIVYGTGVKMPLGFVTRLAQTEVPSNYSKTEREWVNLSTENIKTIANKTGIELFKEIVKSLKMTFTDYSSNNLVWVMNRQTHLDLIVEAMGTNMAAAIVSSMNDTMPVVGGDVVELSFMADGDIAFGYMSNYKLVQRRGIQLAISSEVLFLDDQTAFKGTARYDGKPVIAEAFGLLNINGKVPTTQVKFAPDKANPKDAELSSLKIGSANLFPKFDQKTKEYMVNTANATSKIEAAPLNDKATVTIKNGETEVKNGESATWVDGENKLTVLVSFAGVESEYTVTVNKSA